MWSLSKNFFPAQTRCNAVRGKLEAEKRERSVMIKILVLVAGLCVGAAWPAAQAAPTNNILLIIADDYGADASSLFNSTNTGAHLAPTPNINQLGHSGVLFPYFYARPSCSQSRATFFTGRESFRTG